MYWRVTILLLTKLRKHAGFGIFLKNTLSDWTLICIIHVYRWWAYHYSLCIGINWKDFLGLKLHKNKLGQECTCIAKATCAKCTCTSVNCFENMVLSVWKGNGCFDTCFCDNAFATSTQDIIWMKLGDNYDSDCFLWFSGRGVWTGKVFNFISAGMSYFVLFWDKTLASCQLRSGSIHLKNFATNSLSVGAVEGNDYLKCQF